MSDELPQGWATAPVSDVIEDLQSGFASGEKNVKGGVAHLRMNNIGVSGELVLDLVRTVPEKLTRPYHDLRRGDVLVCTTNSGKLVGKSAYFDLPGRFAFSNHLTRLRPKQNVVDGRFLRWSLWLDWKRGVFDDKCKHWVNQSTLPKDALLETEVVLPPLGEQRRIVTKLDSLLSKVEAGEQRLEKIPTLLHRFRQSVLAAACSGRLTADWRKTHPTESPEAVVGALSEGLPEDWELTQVEHLARIGSGQSSARIISQCKSSGEIPWFKVSDMNLEGNDKFMRRSQNYLSPRQAKELGMKVFPKGTIVFPKRGGAIATNKKRILTRPSCIDSNTMALTPHGCEEGYFALWFSTNDLGQLADGSSVPQINNPDILPLEVPLPPRAEQQEIVRRVNSLFALADQLDVRFTRARAQVDRLTPSLLAKAFRGELVPQDPTDEPASALLERIKANRLTASPSARTARRPRSRSSGADKRPDRPASRSSRTA